MHIGRAFLFFDKVSTPEGTAFDKFHVWGIHNTYLTASLANSKTHQILCLVLFLMTGWQSKNIATRDINHRFLDGREICHCLQIGAISPVSLMLFWAESKTAANFYPPLSPYFAPWPFLLFWKQCSAARSSKKTFKKCKKQVNFNAPLKRKWWFYNVGRKRPNKRRDIRKSTVYIDLKKLDHFQWMWMLTRVICSKK